MSYSDLFENNKFDAFVLTGESNRFYFTKFETSFGAVIVTRDNNNVFITDFRYETEARQKISDFEIVISSFSEFYDKIAATLIKLGVKTVGYEDTMTVGEFRDFKAALKGFALKPASDIIDLKRAVKTDEEIEFIKKAQSIAESALKKAISSVKIGMTERELMAEINYNMIMMGAEKYSFETIVAFGAHTAEPHHHASEAKLERNDIVLVDMGAKFNGYCSDMTRTFGLGTPDERLVSIYGIVREAQEYAIKYIKAGMTCHDADALAREYIASNGYGDNFGHSFGHGVGIDIHESPRVGAGTDIVLVPNMVITAEPGIYIPELGGVRIEDMLVVKADGVENITSYDKKFLI